jgi:anti-sigma factor RsiW
MIEHLSAEQISQWMIGERTPQQERHVAECDECRTELRQLETTLQQFRGAVREWSDSAAPSAWRQPASRGLWYSWPRLVLAAATLLILVAIPVYWSARERQRAAESEAARADALLLERVDSAISQAVPEPMEPLVNLVTWNSSPAEKNNKLERL